ncbi:MAG: AAA family ATPase [Phycisphaeraceae bacterium]|nr:AAA family ATPase [Phycisphaeraceae bacterium]
MDFDQMAIGDLRKELRKQFPSLRGMFAATADKETCVRLLRKELTPRQAFEDWSTKNAGKFTQEVAAEHAEDGAQPPEGVMPLGEVKEDGVASPDPGAKVEAAVERMSKIAIACGDHDLVSAIMELAGSRHEAIRLSAELEALKKVGYVAQPKVVVEESGQSTFMGLPIPIIMMEGSGHAADKIPDPDPCYSYSMWRAVRTCGSIRFDQTPVDVLKALLADLRILMVGAPGTGKTSLFTQIGAMTRWPVTRINGVRDLTLADFVGTYEAKGGETVWVDGPLTTAMRRGHLTIIDEVDHMPAECSSVLHAVLEPKGELTLISRGGERVAPNPNFRLMATANTAGFGDESGVHAAAKVQDSAFMSRWDAVFQLEYPEKDQERCFLMSSFGTPEKEASIITELAAITRDAAADGTLLYPMTLRHSISWAKMSPLLGFGTAFCVAVLNKIPKSDAAAVVELAQRVAGSDLAEFTVS